MNRKLSSKQPQRGVAVHFQIISAVMQMVLSAILLTLTVILWVAGNQISQQNNDIAKEIRKGQIRPILQILPSIISTTNHEHLIIKIHNCGTGIANDLQAVIKKDTTYVQQLIQEFYPRGTYPIADSYGEDEHDGSAHEIGAPPGISSVLAGEDVEFEAGYRIRYDKRQVLTIFVHYSDIDNNDYMTIHKFLADAPNKIQFVDQRSPFLDSLSKLNQSIDIGETKTLENESFKRLDTKVVYSGTRLSH
jgi:hypothetical protein